MGDKILGIGLLLEIWAITVTGNAVGMLSPSTPSYAVTISAVVIAIYTVGAVVLIPVMATAKSPC